MKNADQSLIRKKGRKKENILNQTKYRKINAQTEQN